MAIAVCRTIKVSLILLSFRRTPSGPPHDVPARFGLRLRRDGVFEVEDDRVCVGGEGFLHHPGVGSGNRQKGTPNHLVASRCVTVVANHYASFADVAPSRPGAVVSTSS